MLLFAGLGLRAQVISPQVINSAGEVRTLSNGFTLSDNVGESFITTIGSSPVVSQGFLQPLNFSTPLFTLDVMVTDVSCSGKDDGSVITTLNATSNNYSVRYVWTPTTVCPSGTCTSVDSLTAGTYTLDVIVTYTVGTKTYVDTLKGPDQVTSNRPVLTITDVNGLCKVKVFSGVTLNNDGLNDFLFIENIAEYPNNRLSVYNRWGIQLFDQRGYDNTTKFWPTKEEADNLVPSTYFYVLELGDGSKAIKGWVEIIKN